MPPLLNIGSRHLHQCLGASFAWDRFAEDDILVSLFNKLKDTKPEDFTHDMVKWDLDSKGDFMINLYYFKPYIWITHHHKLSRGRVPFNLIWRFSVPLKVSFFFGWFGRLRTGTFDFLNVEKRGKISVNRCYMCKRDLESVDHLLLHCQCTRGLWELAFSCVGIFGSLLIELQIIFWLGRATCSRKVKKKKALDFPCVFFASLWRERNQKDFDDHETPLFMFGIKRTFPLQLSM